MNDLLSIFHKANRKQQEKERKHNKNIERAIEKALEKTFPGIRIKLTINMDKSWSIVRLDKSKTTAFYDLYPGMSKDEADAQIIIDITNIIFKYIPKTDETSYERYGQKHTIANS